MRTHSEGIKKVGNNYLFIFKKKWCEKKKDKKNKTFLLKMFDKCFLICYNGGVIN